MRELLEELSRGQNPVRQFWTSRYTWLSIAFIGVAATSLLAMMQRLQQADTRQRLEAARAQSVVEIEGQMVKLIEAERASVRDRNHIRKDVEEIKEDIEGVPPAFMKAGKVVKKAVDQAVDRFKAQGER